MKLISNPHKTLTPIVWWLEAYFYCADQRILHIPSKEIAFLNLTFHPQQQTYGEDGWKHDILSRTEHFMLFLAKNFNWLSIPTYMTYGGWKIALMWGSEHFTQFLATKFILSWHPIPKPNLVWWWLWAWL